jgi:hypothetical protein
MTEQSQSQQQQAEAVPGEGVQAIYVNRFHVVAYSNGLTRISFGEQVTTASPDRYRIAVMMQAADVLALAATLTSMLAGSPQEITQQP